MLWLCLFFSTLAYSYRAPRRGTARNAGAPVVAVDFGYSETPIGQLGADRLISHYDALAAAVLEVVPAVR